MKHLILTTGMVALALNASAQDELTAKARSKLETAGGQFNATTPGVPAEIEAAPAVAAAPVSPVSAALLPANTGAAQAGVTGPEATESAAQAVAPASTLNLRAPLPLVLQATIFEICMPVQRGELSLPQGLPAGAVPGMGEAIAERLIARPQDGRIWTLTSLEGEFLVGNLAAREGACQIIAATPIGDVVMDQVTGVLTGGESTFAVVDETGTDQGTPIHWRRLKSDTDEFIDILHYKGVPGGQASTIHVIVG